MLLFLRVPYGNYAATVYPGIPSQVVKASVFWLEFWVFVCVCVCSFGSGALAASGVRQKSRMKWHRLFLMFLYSSYRGIDQRIDHFWEIIGFSSHEVGS